MPLVIHSLGDGHTNTHTCAYRRPHRNNFKKPGVRQPCSPDLKTFCGILLCCLDVPSISYYDERPEFHDF